MRHSGNHSRVINQSFGDRGVTLKVYVYDELDRFVTVTNLSLDIREIEAYITAIQDVRFHKEQGILW